MAVPLRVVKKVMTEKNKIAGILGKKLGMTQIFQEDGEVIPVTVVLAGPCAVVQRKTDGSDGYEAIQLSFEEVPERKVTRPRGGHFKKAGIKPHRYLREFPVTHDCALKVGHQIKAEHFKSGDIVHVTGTSKGKGFQGVIKRHHKAGGPASHGSRFHRTTGSIGQRTSPGEVFKNMKLPGHLGDVRVTVKTLKIVGLNPEENLLYIRGAVPGATNGFLLIRNTSEDFLSRVVQGQAGQEKEPQAEDKKES